MTTEMIIELVGYLGSLIVLVSFLMSSVVRLRIVNAVGGLIFAIYAIIIHSYPTALMNFCLIGINIYYLIRLTRSTRHYSLLEGNLLDAYLQYFLQYYREDIRVYFPEAPLHQPEKHGIDRAYLVCSDAVPVGLLLGKSKEEGTLEICVDYSTPEYRDCSVGAYLYDKLSSQGIQRLTFPFASQNHEGYLKKMGFEKENGVYTKVLEGGNGNARISSARK